MDGIIGGGGEKNSILTLLSTHTGRDSADSFFFNLLEFHWSRVTMVGRGGKIVN